MDFEFTEAQKLLQQSVRDFVKKEYPPERARKDEEEENFPKDLFSKMAALGWLAAPFPEAYGGIGGGAIEECIIIEELTRVAGGSAGIAYFLSVCFGGKTLEAMASEEQKQNYLRKLCNGESMYALAITEPDGGTDVLRALKTIAVEDEEGFVINGQKMFITTAHLADYLITVTRTAKEPAKPSRGVSIFIVPAKSPGVTSNVLEKLGIKANPTCEVFFEDVKVPRENLLGEKDNGWHGIINTLNNERTSLAALCVGMGEGALDLASEYVRQRTAFGKPIGQFQAIQHYLADISTKLEAARLLTYKAAWKQQSGQPSAIESAKAKLFASEVSHEASVVGMRILAGASYMMDYDMQRFYRDSVLFLFAPITNEMCKNFIAEAEFQLPRAF
jgi:alkylation response protein AidB-like acyl-CoA dehydrogenase